MRRVLGRRTLSDLIPNYELRHNLLELARLKEEPTVEGLLIKGRPSTDVTMARLKEHVERIRRMGVKGPSLGDLRQVFLEMEFEADKA